MDHVMYHIFKIIFSKMSKTLHSDLPLNENIHKKENRIAFNIKRGYDIELELLTSEVMELLGSTKDNQG